MIKTNRAALSYNSKRGIARSFIFFGTARTSIEKRKVNEKYGREMLRTPLWHLYQEEFLALLWLRYVCWHKRVLMDVFSTSRSI
jgi:hypothetical protein